MQLTEENALRILTPDNPEHWLTNGESYSKKVYLGKNASPDDWAEVEDKNDPDEEIDPAEALEELEKIL